MILKYWVSRVGDWQVRLHPQQVPDSEYRELTWNRDQSCWETTAGSATVYLRPTPDWDVYDVSIRFHT